MYYDIFSIKKLQLTNALQHKNIIIVLFDLLINGHDFFIYMSYKQHPSLE